MAGCGPHYQLPPDRQAWTLCVAVALGVAVVVLAVSLPTVLCQWAAGSAMVGNSSVGLAQMEKALAVTNQSLAEAHRQWDSCREQLVVLERKGSELKQALANITQLQDENMVLKAEMVRQQEQLRDLQSSRDKLQLQNRLLQEQLQDMKSQHSGGSRLPAVSLSLLALLLPGMLCL
ncbi:uncharacterized protein RDI95_013118 isoform 1-T1 [Morus bassanus]